ncbi:DUF1120 domain-containing protein [Pseudomonas sp. K2I15]|uniref:DUF1120 domain-containing protein n=1 Tax=unclassified Pseudomonas TaxID=196821 RepID=UPI000B4D4812|nr:DUF1120 domain-containing protein [Pseudomonas sp. K2I15]OWP71326.1 hypothetical protein CEC48_13220 [Pseudomonas sp. K2I15]
MNKQLSALAACLLLVGTQSAFAASSVDLIVKGLITPSACTPVLSGGGTVDHGKISAKDLQPTNPTLIGTHTLTMSVSCDAPITFGLNAIDNRAGSAMQSSDFGLGFINGTQKIGSYNLMLQNPVADSVAVQPITSGDNGTTWSAERSWERGYYMSVGAMDDDTQPLAVKDLTMAVQIQTVIARADSLDLSNEVTIDGSATLEVKYL